MRLITLGLVAAVVVVLSFLVCRKVANANRPYSSATERILRGGKYTEAFEGMVYRGSVEDARRLAHHYDLVDSPPGRGSLCTLISGCIGNDIDVHNWTVERMYGSKDFATEAWIKKVEKVVPDSESWFYGAYAHLAIAVAAGTNNAAILKLQTSLREKGVAESVCNVERMATVPLNADYSPEKGLARATEKTKTTTLQTTLQATLQTTLQGTSLKIAQMMLSRPEIKIDEIASAVGLTRDGVNYQIRRLKKLVGLRHDGADQSGRWMFASNAIDERQ